MSRYLSFALVRCFDERRDESLNVGVVLIDAARGRALFRVADDFRRHRAALPDIPYNQLGTVLPSLMGDLSAAVRTDGLAALEQAQRKWKNVVRLSSVRGIEARSMAPTLSALFDRFVATPGRIDDGLTVQPPERSVTDRRVVQSVVKRLRTRQFEEGVDFRKDVQISGRTRSGKRVPVWYPLKVGRTRFYEAFTVSPSKEREAIDAARLVAKKAEETFRIAAAEYHVDVMVRAKEGGEKNARKVREVIIDEGTVNGSRPSVFVYEEAAELGPWVEKIPLPNLQLPFEGEQ